MFLGEMQSNPNRQNGAWLTIRELADQLHVSRDTVERWIHDGQLRAVDVGTLARNGAQRVFWRIDPDDLEVFLEGRANKPAVPRKTHHKRNKTEVIEFIK